MTRQWGLLSESSPLATRHSARVWILGRDIVLLSRNSSRPGTLAKSGSSASSENPSNVQFLGRDLQTTHPLGALPWKAGVGSIRQHASSEALPKGAGTEVCSPDPGMHPTLAFNLEFVTLEILPHVSQCLPDKKNSPGELPTSNPEFRLAYLSSKVQGIELCNFKNSTCVFPEDFWECSTFSSSSFLPLIESILNYHYPSFQRTPPFGSKPAFLSQNP